MNPGADNSKWFALQIRTRSASSAALLLSGKGYEVFYPTYKVRRHRSGGLKGTSAPLFPGYLFCHFDPQKRLPILVTPGVIAVVSRGRIPLPVDDSEIDAIQAIVSSGFQAEPCSYLEIGQRVRVESDGLRGIEGILVDFKGNHRVVLSISLLRRSVALEIDRACVRPISPTRSALLSKPALVPCYGSI